MSLKNLYGQIRYVTSLGQMRDTLTKLKAGLGKVVNGTNSRSAVIVTQNLDIIDALCVRYGKTTTMRELADRLFDEAHDEYASKHTCH